MCCVELVLVDNILFKFLLNANFFRDFVSSLIKFHIFAPGNLTEFLIVSSSRRKRIRGPRSKSCVIIVFLLASIKKVVKC